MPISKPNKIDPNVLGRHFMAHMIATCKAELCAGRRDAVNIQEAVVSLLSQYKDLSLTDVDPTNPEPEVAKILSEHSDLQLVEVSRKVLIVGLEGNRKFVKFITWAFVPEPILLCPLEKVLQELPRRNLVREMTTEGIFGIDTGRMDCALCIRTVEFGTEVVEVPCEHWFHPDCFESWLRKCRKCPVCCQDIGRSTKKVVEKKQRLDSFPEKKSAMDEEDRDKIIE